jgi:hypothetical protein
MMSQNIITNQGVTGLISIFLGSVLSQCNLTAMATGMYVIAGLLLMSCAVNFVKKYKI